MVDYFIDKPGGYKSHMIVNDPNPKLVINLDYTLFQACTDLSDDECDEFEVAESGDQLHITKKD